MHSITTAQWVLIRDALARHYGLYLDESRKNQACNVVLQRCKVLGTTPAVYQQQIQTSQGSGELHWLAEQLANHETLFFRNPAHFRALEHVILPELHKSRPLRQSIRCWSAGCATGEEAYSIAMTASHLWGAPITRPVHIYGTDLSREALLKARRGEYRGRTLTNIQPHHQRWLLPNENATRKVHPQVQSLVQFEQHNLLDSLPPWAVNLDVVFCQNVTIYFQLETCRKLIERIYDALSVGGYLLLGFSESLWGIFDGFETVEMQGAFVYRKPAQRPQPRSRTQPLASKAVAAAPAKPRPPRPPPRVAPKALELDSTLEQARALRHAGEQRRALAQLSQLAPEAHTPAMLSLVAQLHADLGQREQAAAEARRALELDVMQEAAYVVLGMIELHHGEWSKAAYYLERALYLMPNSPTVSFHLAESYRHQERFDAARREYANTARKLGGVSDFTLYDGIAAGWLRTTCERWIASLDQREHQH